MTVAKLLLAFFFILSIVVFTASSCLVTIINLTVQ